MRRPSIELAALDIAGTTVEEHGAVYEALHTAVREAGSTATTADVQHWMGAEKRAAIRALLTIRDTPAATPDVATPDVAMPDVATPATDADDVDEALVGESFVRFTRLLAEAYETRPPEPLPGVPETIATLRAAGVKVALTTGFTRDVATGILATLGWSVAAGPDQWLSPEVTLDALVCADEVPVGRPGPHLIHRAMERTGVLDVAAVLAAGDTVLDLQAGRNAGVGTVVGVLTGKLGAGDLGRERHDLLLESVADIPGVLP